MILLLFVEDNIDLKQNPAMHQNRIINARNVKILTRNKTTTY